MASHEPVDTSQDFPALEQEVLERWREAKTFERQLEKNAGGEVWSFYEGPPTANGKPGSHHVLSRVFKDIYPRYRAMCGYDVPRKAGWDCHGLPVELVVEKELGISSKEEIEEFGVAEFNQRCRDSVLRYVDVWNKLSERIGFWVDLENPYVTMENDYIELPQRPPDRLRPTPRVFPRTSSRSIRSATPANCVTRRRPTGACIWSMSRSATS